MSKAHQDYCDFFHRRGWGRWATRWWGCWVTTIKVRELDCMEVRSPDQRSVFSYVRPPICHPCSQGLLCWSCGYLWSWANQKVTCSGVVACFGGIQVIQGPRIPSISPSVAAKMWGLSRAPQDHTGVTAFQSKNYFLLYVFLLHLRSLIEFPELHLSESLICLTG